MDKCMINGVLYFWIFNIRDYDFYNFDIVLVEVFLFMLIVYD